MSAYEELRQEIADYLTSQFIYRPDELPKDECHKEAAHVLARIFRTLENVTPEMTLAYHRCLPGPCVSDREWIEEKFLAMLRAAPIAAPAEKEAEG